MKHGKILRKIAYSLTGCLLAFSMMFGAVTPALANLPVVDATAAADRTAEKVIDTVKEKLRTALISALSAELLNLLLIMSSQLAENTAVWVASGGNADSPLFNSRPPADYFKYAGGRVISEIYNEVASEDFQCALTHLCFATASDIQLSLRLGLKEMAGLPNPDFDCPNLEFVKDSWPAYVASLQTSVLDPNERTAIMLSAVSDVFDPDVNELSTVVQFKYYAAVTAFEEGGSEETNLVFNDGFQAVTHYITGSVETPASFVHEELEHAIQQQQDQSFTLGQALLANSDTLMAIGINAGSIFANTLFSELMSKYQTGLFEDLAFDDNPFDSDSTLDYSRERISEIFRSLNTFKPLEVTDYSLLSELSTCPPISRGSSPGLYNCAIDSSFVSAVALSKTGSTLTLQDAIDEGYIDSSWPLIPSADTARNQDTKCYTYGFCHSNLVKLRKARVISIGWELAAESEHNSESSPVTLQEVIDGFHSCNSDGELDDEHPWCHLVDPNWILKFPDTQCRTLAYGQILTASGTDERAEECVDIQSCISEDAGGNCDGGYGYCVREENTWKFRGTECPEHYATCMTFESEEGEDVDYLTNTLDYDDCSSSNTGCYWYSTEKELNDDIYDWPVITNVADADAEAYAFDERVYFNAAVESCDATDAGCSELYERDSDSSLNLISNSSFENDEDENGYPDGWLISDEGAYSSADGISRSGSASVHVTDDGEIAEKYGIVLNQAQNYTLSFYAYAPTQDQGTITLAFEDELGVAVSMDAQSVSGICSGDGCYTTCIGSGDEIESFAEANTGDFERFDCTFSTPALTDRSLDIYAKLSIEAQDVYFDDIMLEQSATASMYDSGYSDTLVSTYMKVAPDYLGCTGADTDPDECAGYAAVCAEQDAGCGEYTPVNGDPSVTAVVSLVDQCPSTCVGYDTYRQEASTYEPFGDFPVYFIPDSADECSEAAVGCTEFTNLNTEAREYYTSLRSCVTEDQAAANVGDAAATYYTWEGSDEEGYQLRTWRLLESDLDSWSNYAYIDSGEINIYPGKAPCSSWTSEADGVSCNDDADGDGVLDADIATCDEHVDILVNPNCREFYDTAGGIHYRLWEDTVTVNDACTSYRLSDLAGDSVAEREDSCEGASGYYDSTGDFCRFFGLSEESTECRESENGCRAFTGGRSANSRLVLEDLFEDGTLENWDAGSASAVTLSNESVAVDGHSLKSEGEIAWSHFYDEGSECATEEGCDSSTGTLGGSCEVQFGEQYCGTLEGDLFTGKTYTLTFWAKGDTDLDVGFDIDADISSIEVDSLVDSAVPSVELTSEWAYYSVGPFDMNEIDYAGFDEGSVLAFVPDSTGDFYIDNVVLREGEDELTLIKDSWVTPGECDMSWEGTTSAQFHLGCQEYTDQNSDTYYLKSFRNLCDGDAVGCEAYYATQNSDSAYGQVFNATCYNIDSDGDGSIAAEEKTACYLRTDTARTSYDETSPLLCYVLAGEESCQFDLADLFIPQSYISDEATYPEFYHIYYGPDTTIVDPDNSAYLIYDENFECSSSDSIGCTEMGEPVFTSDRTVVESWETVYLLNDPDEYESTLCIGDDLFCNSYDSSSEGTWYFKDPLGQTCEYKSDVTIDSTSYTGWFREGTSNFCYGEGVCSGDDVTACSLDSDCADAGLGTCNITDGSYLIGGDESGIWRNGDTDYSNWVGICSSEYDGCSAFEDPLSLDDDEFYTQSAGEMFYYLDNDQLEDGSLLSSQRCNGQVSQKEGCTLFYDSGDVGSDYNASATYVVSTHADEILGEEPFSLVDPIDCASETTSSITLPDGTTTYDPCASRCAYPNINLVGSTSNGIYTIGQSCYVDEDCPNYEGYTGDIVSGFCTTQDVASVDPFTLVFTYEPVERLENDTNRVISVNQDRVCAEWLSCSSSYSIWDQDAGKYRTICEAVDLCTEYSAEGHPSFCSDWDPSDPAVVLDSDRYVARDVTWYGEEYSGYSIPEVLPLQHLDQVNVAPPAGYCNLSNHDEDDVRWAGFHGESCDSDWDCVDPAETSSRDEGDIEGLCADGEADYRLGYIAGSCSEEYAEDCAVGYCSDTGSACTQSSDCESDDAVCAPGVCYALSETVCESDSDCADGEECMSGACATQGGYCSLNEDDVDDLTCDTGETCFTSTAYKQGSCYESACFLAMNGEAFEDELYEGQVCRAYPEIDSPFGTNVVTEWGYVDPTGTLQKTESESTVEFVDTDSVSASPRSYLSGFSAVETCAPGEDCVCSYTELSNNNLVSVYAAPDTTLVDEFSSTLGICSADSLVAGALCLSDGDCQSTSSSSATCDQITSENTVYGLEGYCLERDTGLNIEGDQNTGACVTWFPVDQISGATDLYAKYVGAGYFEDTYMCSYLSPFVDIRTTIAESFGEGGIACAESSGGVSSSNAYSTMVNECAARVACPSGFYAVMGLPAFDGTTANNSYADACVEASFADNDCPYVCVPDVSYNSEGVECSALLSDDDFRNTVTSDSGVEVYPWSETGSGVEPTNENYVAFNEIVDQFADCWMRGVDYGTAADILSFPESTQVASSGSSTSGEGSSGTNGYRYLIPVYTQYPGCSEMLEVASSNESYAWTDRLYGDSDYILPATNSSLTYNINTSPHVFGASQVDPSGVEVYGPPIMVATCEDSDGATLELPSRGSGSSYTTCDTEYNLAYYDVDPTDPEDPDARAHVVFEYMYKSDAVYISSLLDSYYWDTVASPWSVSGDPINAITGVFAHVGFGSIFSWFDSSDTHPTDQAYEEESGGASTYDSYDVRGNEGIPPAVWSVDVNNCGSNYCEEGTEGAITLNNQDSGDQESDEGFFRATMKFYAAAYKEQLPIRAVIVDWGDNEQTGELAEDNFFKNHRGLIPNSQTQSICSVCSDPSSSIDCEWGMTSDSCDPNYFIYQHSYRCYDADELPECSPDADGNLTNSPCSYDDESCSYQPRIHIRDNWGWCTGECEGSGCYDEYGDLSSLHRSSQCNFEIFPERSDAYDPWVYYDGIITVEE